MDYPFINDIVEQLLSNSFSVFCGAGATADSKCSKWEDLFSTMTMQFYENKISDDIYLLSDLEKNYYNSNNYFEDIEKKLREKENSAENFYLTHNAEENHIFNILKLNLNQIWTTNFDEIIEKTILKVYGINPVVFSSSTDFLTKKLNAEYVIYKLNGTVSKRDSMVLTKTDFYNYFKRQRLFFEFLKRQLVLDSFLFIGYSFKDELVLSALREIKEVFAHNGKTHYRFLKISTEHTKKRNLIEKYSKYENQYFKDKYNIETILIDDFNNIDTYLNEVYRRFANHNVFISGSFRNITNELRIYIEKLVDSIIKKLYYNDFNIYSGNGRGLGEMVVARANLHAHRPNNKFVNRPLIFTGDTPNDKQKKNDKIIKDCNTMIIICGQDESLESSVNVENQYEKFINQPDKLVIPIPTTEYAAKKIFSRKDFTESIYYKFEPELYNKISRTHNIEELSDYVVNLVLKYRKEP